MSNWYADYVIDNLDDILLQIEREQIIPSHDDLCVREQLDRLYRTLDRHWDKIDGATLWEVRLYKPRKHDRVLGHVIVKLHMHVSPRYV
jgi:hypothetical protein